MEETRLKSLEMDVSQISKNMQTMSNSIEAIRVAITGNDLGDEGLAKRIHTLETNQKQQHDHFVKLEQKQNKLLYYILGGSTAGATALSSVIQHFM